MLANRTQLPGAVATLSYTEEWEQVSEWKMKSCMVHLFVPKTLLQRSRQLDPVGSTVRYELMKLYWVSIGHYEAVAVGNGRKCD